MIAYKTNISQSQPVGSGLGSGPSRGKVAEDLDEALFQME